MTLFATRARRLVGACRLLTGLLALAPTVRAQDSGLLGQYLGDDEGTLAAIHLWIDAFNDVGDAIAGLEQAAGLPAGEMTITLESYYADPPPTGRELERRGLARVARYGAAGAVRLHGMAFLTGRFVPPEAREAVTRLLLTHVGTLEGVLRQAADLATEALVCTGDVPVPGAPTACGDPVDPAVWMQLRDEINVLSSAVERVLLGSDVDD